MTEEATGRIRLDGDASGFDKAQRLVIAGLGSIQKEVKATNKSVKDLWDGFGAATASLGVVVAALDAAAQRSLQLHNVFGNLKGSIEGAQKASQGLASAYDLATSQTKALRLGAVGTEKDFARLTGAATKLALSTGGDATKGIEDATTALARASPQILDNLGVTLTIAEATRRYAASLGVEADELTEVQRKQAFAVEGLKAMELAARAVSLETDNAAGAWARAKVALGDFIDQALIVDVTVKDGIETIKQATAAWLGAEESLHGLDDLHKVFSATVLETNPVLWANAEILGLTADNAGRLRGVMDRATQSYAQQKLEVQNAVAAVNALRDANEQLARVAQKNVVDFTTKNFEKFFDVKKDAHGGIIGFGVKDENKGKGKGKGKGRGAEPDFLEGLFGKAEAGRMKSEQGAQQEGALDAIADLLVPTDEIVQRLDQYRLQLEVARQIEDDHFAARRDRMELEIEALKNKEGAEFEVAQSQLELAGMVAEHEGNLHQQRMLRYEREALAVRKAEAQKQRAWSVSAKHVQGMTDLTMATLGGAVQTASEFGNMQAKDRLRIEGIMTLAGAAREQFEAIASFARYDFYGGALHEAAAIFGFVQGGLLLSGQVPNSQKGGAGGGGVGGGSQNPFANNGQGPGGQTQNEPDKVPISPVDEQGKRPGGSKKGGGTTIDARGSTFFGGNPEQLARAFNRLQTDGGLINGKTMD